MFSWSILASFALFAFVLWRKIIPIINSLIHEKSEEVKKRQDLVVQQEREATLNLKKIQKEVDGFDTWASEVRESAEAECQSIKEAAEKTILEKEHTLANKKVYTDLALKKRKEQFRQNFALQSFYKALQSDLSQSKKNALSMDRRSK